VGLSVADAMGHHHISCISLTREAVDPTTVYFDKKELGFWRGAHSQVRRNSELGKNPHAETMMGIEDANDFKQQMMAYFMEIPWHYSIMVSSFLTIFMPDNCQVYETNCPKNKSLGTHTSAGMYVFTFNVLTCGIFFFANLLVNRREIFLIEWLDADDEFPQAHLSKIIHRYPKIKAMLMSQNRRVFFASLLVIIMLIINFISSCTLLLHRNLNETVCCPGVLPHSVKIVITLVTSVLLVLIKLIRIMRVSKRSLQMHMGISSTFMLPLSYNCIDHDHVNDEQGPDPEEMD
jgi:hypothetical protein